MHIISKISVRMNKKQGGYKISIEKFIERPAIKLE